MARKKRVKKCAHCGQTFEIQPHEHDDKQFCDKVCFYASRTGMSRTEWLFEHGAVHEAEMPRLRQADE